MSMDGMDGMDGMGGMGSMDGMGGMDMGSSGLFKSTDMKIARAFWYVIAGLVAVKTCNRVLDSTRTRLAKRKRRVEGGGGGRLSSSSGPVRARVPSRPGNFLAQVYETATAITRELSYPQLKLFKGRFARHFSLPPLGHCLILAAYWVMVLAMLWTNVLLTKSSSMYGYRWEKVGFRAAWVTVTQLPLLYCLGGKFNIISVLTGVSYERLNWLHRWVARTMFLTAIVHWAYFFTEWSMADFVQFEIEMMPMVKYGFGAWAVIGWTILVSFGFLRNAGYEIWLVQHLASAGVLLWLLYVHVPSYARYNIWMAVGFIAFDRGARSLWMVAHNVKWPGRKSAWLGFEAEVSEPCRGYLHVRIRKVNFGWNAGQHVFISLPGCGFWESHPFTIASSSSSSSSSPCFSSNGKMGKEVDLEVYIKCRSGFTKRLQSKVDKQQTGRLRTRALLSKPLGSAPLATIERADSLILIASSTGASFTLPILEHVLANNNDNNEKNAKNAKRPPCFVQRIRFYWIVRHVQQLGWFQSRIAAAQQSARDLGIEFGGQIYVTGSGPEVKQLTHLAHLAWSCSSSPGSSSHSSASAGYNRVENEEKEKAQSQSHSHLPTTAFLSREEGEIERIDNATSTPSPTVTSTSTATSSTAEYAAAESSSEQAPLYAKDKSNCRCRCRCKCKFKGEDEGEDERKEDEQSSSPSHPIPIPIPIPITHGRPQPSAAQWDPLIYPTAIKSEGETAIIACGHGDIMAELRNYVARLSDERAVHKGTGAQGIFLHTESYGY